MSSSTSYDSEELREMIREAGLRCTSSRATVLEFLAGASKPQSHADVSEQLVPEGLDQATIYRNLTDLTDAGLLKRLDLGDHVWRFEFREDEDDDEEHSHFVCTDCGEIACLAPVGLSFDDDGGDPARVGEVDQVFLKGRCAECS